jgi:hypothetical protein
VLKGNTALVLSRFKKVVLYTRKHKFLHVNGVMARRES